MIYPLMMLLQLSRAMLVKPMLQTCCTIPAWTKHLTLKELYVIMVHSSQIRCRSFNHLLAMINVVSNKAMITITVQLLMLVELAKLEFCPMEKLYSIIKHHQPNVLSGIMNLHQKPTAQTTRIHSQTEI
jgi:hypothetical protein